MARALGQQGAHVHLVARSAAALDEACAGLEAGGSRPLPIPPLTDSDALTQLTRDAGAVDILVNAAGVNLRQPYAEVTPEAFDLHMALHLRAPFFLVQYLAPRHGFAWLGQGVEPCVLAIAAGFSEFCALWRGQGGYCATDPRHGAGIFGARDHLQRDCARVFSHAADGSSVR